MPRVVESCLKWRVDRYGQSGGFVTPGMLHGARTIGDGLRGREDNFLCLRIIAALMVIYGHSLIISPSPGVTDLFGSWRTYSGEIAVDIFFALSGFMVSGSFMRRPDLVDFMTARVLRLVPALLVCLVLTAYVLGPLLSNLDAHSYFSEKLPRRFVKWNLQFAWRQSYLLPGVFTTNSVKDTVNGSLWTIPAEMRMYVFLAIFGVLGFFRSRRVATLILLALFVVGAVVPWQLPLFDGWIKMSGYFGLGVLAFIYRDDIPVRTDVMFALIYLAFLSRAVWIYPVFVALAITYFCFWFAYRLKLPNIERFGDPSYGTYLWGWPTSQVFAQFVGAGHPYGCALTAGLVCLMLGYLSWHTIEKPALRLKSRVHSILRFRERAAQ